VCAFAATIDDVARRIEQALDPDREHTECEMV
jgi:hypothetical protein